ncbi:NAD(P)/FAD-dependent oxidoreductase [Leucobacter soli]
MTRASERLVIVGASLAGLRAAEAARASGFSGEIVLIGEEKETPYDRPFLSKEFLEEGEAPEPVRIASTEAIAEQGIRMMLGERATALDAGNRTVVTDQGEHRYDSAVIATGSGPIRLPAAEGLPGVVALRTLEDARTVRDALDAEARVVVIGGGFIGAEVASGARRRGLDATIIEAADVPLVRAVGAEIGGVLAELHGRHGTELRCGAGVTGFVGDEQVEAVELAGGERIAADLVVVGIGTRPAVGWLEGSGIEIENGVVCDATLSTSDPHVYAAGDVANWWNGLFGRTMRIEHFTAAAEQGARAGRNAVAGRGSQQVYETVPYFWSDWYGSRIQSAGVITTDFEVVSGDLRSDHFVVVYRDGERLSGVLTLNGQRHIMKYRRMIADRASYEQALDFAASRNRRVVMGA